MTRSELADLLALLVRQNRITQEEAAEVLRLFDAGELEASTLPLPVAEALQAEDRSKATLLFLLALLASTVSLSQARTLFAGNLAHAVRRRLSEQLRQDFEKRMIELAGQTGSLRRWQADMADAVSNYLWRQYAAGAGRTLTAAESQLLQRRVQEQLAYLHRYSAEIATRLAQGKPFSVAYLANRNLQYGGVGWELWHRGAEADSAPGYVYDYIAVDDQRTCTPCHVAGMNGPYLPGQGPMPGQVCRARGKCRCRRVPRWAPAIWEQLSGRKLAA